MGRRGRASFGRDSVTLFVTTTVMNFDRVFGLGDSYYQILLKSLRHVIEEHEATLYAYVFMPSHIHLVVTMPEGESISDMMRDFKKYTSTKIRQQLESDGHAMWVERLRANVQIRQDESPDGTRKRAHTHSIERQVFKLWMDRFDDVVIYSQEMMRVKVRYIHENPVKAGLVEKAEDWKYSSARNYFLSDHSLIYVETDW